MQYIILITVVLIFFYALWLLKKYPSEFREFSLDDVESENKNDKVFSKNQKEIRLHLRVFLICLVICFLLAIFSWVWAIYFAENPEKITTGMSILVSVIVGAIGVFYRINHKNLNNRI